MTRLRPLLASDPDDIGDARLTTEDVQTLSREREIALRGANGRAHTRRITDGTVRFSSRQVGDGGLHTEGEVSAGDGRRSGTRRTQETSS